jgi:hypothetical protein
VKASRAGTACSHCHLHGPLLLRCRSWCLGAVKSASLPPSGEGRGTSQSVEASGITDKNRPTQSAPLVSPHLPLSRNLSRTTLALQHTRRHRPQQGYTSSRLRQSKQQLPTPSEACTRRNRGKPEQWRIRIRNEAVVVVVIAATGRPPMCAPRPTL